MRLCPTRRSAPQRFVPLLSESAQCSYCSDCTCIHHVAHFAALIIESVSACTQCGASSTYLGGVRCSQPNQWLDAKADAEAYTTLASSSRRETPIRTAVFIRSADLRLDVGERFVSSDLWRRICLRLLYWHEPAEFWLLRDFVRHD